MTKAEKKIRDFCGHHADWWPSTTQVQEMVVLLQKDWKGLTDEEIKEIIGPWGDTPVKGYTRKLFDQIENALRSKNT